MKPTAGFLLFTVFLAGMIGAGVMFHQDNSKNTIRVLIDRYPLFDCTSSCQALDITARRLQPLMDEFHYALRQDPNHDRILLTNASRPTIEFDVIRDEITRALLFLRGDADVLYDSLSLSKTEWVRKQRSGIRIYAAPGSTLSYLGFQSHHPILKNPLVRRAIAQALPIQDWIRYSFFGWVARDTEIRSPKFDPAQANALLDQAGYPVRDGKRFSLRYFTTPVQEGHQTAQLVREALKSVGIDVQLVTLETSLFFEKIRKGDFELFSSRWFRFSKEAPVREILGTGESRNYVHYSNPILEERARRNPATSLADVRDLIEKDLPILPLYTWNHGLVVSARLSVPSDIETKLDETFRFLGSIGIK